MNQRTPANSFHSYREIATMTSGTMHRQHGKALMWLTIIGTGALTSSAIAAVSLFTASLTNPTERLAWEEQVGQWDTLDFIDVPPAAIVPPEFYADEFGVTFENGTIISFMSEFSFPIDGHGFGTQGSSDIDVVFDTPIRAFAIDHPSILEVTLFAGDEMLYTTGLVGGGPPGRFTGLISDVPFDRVILSDSDGFLVDDIRFGLAVPAPAAGLLLLPGLALAGRHRRRSN